MTDEGLTLLRDDFFESFEGRSLQDNTTDVSGANDGQVLRDTLKVYGSICAALFSLFCILRCHFPRKFNIRSWVQDLKCRLAQDALHYGCLGWFLKIRLATDDEIRDQCGMDALCFLRMIQFGLKIAVLGIINSMWLFPTYATSESSVETLHITDLVIKMSVSYVPPGSNRFIATVIASYIVFGYTMYLILREFKWFTGHRHKFLSERVPRNYSVYVSGIPEELRSSAKLLKYVQACFTKDSILEAHVALKIPKLEKKVANREALVLTLEHFINIEEIKDRMTRKRGQNVVPGAIEELNDLNEQIEDDITRIENMYPILDARSVAASQRNDGSVMGGYNMQSSLPDGFDCAVSLNGGGRASGSVVNGGSVANGGSVVSGARASVSVVNGGSVVNGNGGSIMRGRSRGDGPGSVVGNTDTASLTDDSGCKSAKRGLMGSVHKSFATSGKRLGSSAISMLGGYENGEPRNAGFVTFTKLSTKQAALQMIHHPKPFCMDVSDAPDPDDIFFKNVGKTNRQLQMGKLISFSLTILLCLFWTIPVSFIASLTSVDALAEQIPFLADWIEKVPWLGEALAMLAPLLLIAVNGLLPIFLQLFSSLEGPVSKSVLSAITFPKLAAFMIVQTFFVSAISGGIFQEVSNIVTNPTAAIDLLASSLPSQSTYFIQILLVRTFIGLSVELLRISPLAIAFLRSKIGPNLTREESSRPFVGFLHPLNDPTEFQHTDVAANNVLYFMVLFVYSVIAPIVNWFLAFCFILMISAYRYQFVCNYPTKPDSGGRMWMSFIGIIQVAMIIAQLTLLGLLALKKSLVGVPLMVPLVAATFIFNWYVGQRHRQVANTLPSQECMKVDRRFFVPGREDYSFLVDKYKQPALKEKSHVYPDNLSVTRELEHGNARFETPPGSEADIDE